MKTLFIAQIMDSLSESIIATFTGANRRMIKSQFDGFIADCVKKSLDTDNFTCVIVNESSVCETYKELEDYACNCSSDCVLTSEPLSAEVSNG